MKHLKKTLSFGIALVFFIVTLYSALAVAPYFNATVPNMTIAEGNYNDTLNLSLYVNDTEGFSEFNWTTWVNDTNVSADFDNVSKIFNVSATADWYGSAQVNLTVWDNASESNTTSIFVTFTNVNDAPYNNGTIGNVVFDEDMYNDTTDLDLWFDDIDSSDLNYTSSCNNVNLTTTIDNTTGLVNFTGLGNWSGVVLCNFTAFDGYNSSNVSNNMQITINAVNDAPLFSGILPNVTFYEDGNNNTINLSNYVYDVDNSLNELNYTISLNSSAIVTVVGDNSTKLLNIVGNSNQYGDTSANITVWDPSGLNANFTDMLITVNAVNDAPWNNGTLQDITFDEDTYNDSLDLDSWFYDVEGDNLNYTYSCNNTNNLTVDINNATGLVNFTADANWYGVAYCNFTAYDYMNMSNVSNNILVTVNSVNDAPWNNGTIPNIVFDEDMWNDTLYLDPWFYDIESDAMNYTYSCNDANLTVDIDNATGMINFTSAANWSGVVLCNYTAYDTFMNSSNVSNNMQVTVNPVNDAPVIVSLNNLTVNEDASAVTWDLTGNKSDIDDNLGNLTWSVFPGYNASLVTINTVGDDVTFTFAANQSGTTTALFRLRDDDNANDLQNVTITVNPVNDAPYFNATIGNYSAVEDTVSSVNLSGYYGDIDNTLSALSIVTNSTTAYGDGELLVFNYTTASADFNESVMVYVTDGNANSTGQGSLVSVSWVSDTPSLNQIPDQVVLEDANTSSINLTSYLVDEEGNNMTYVLLSENASQVDCEINGSWLYYTPAAEWNGVGANASNCSLYAYEESNSSMVTNNVTFAINVTAVDDAVNFLSSIGPLAWNEDNNFTFDMANNFNNTDDEQLNYWNTSVDNISVSYSGSSVTFVPDANWYGTRYIVINASDLVSNVESNNITLIVSSVNDAPVITVPDQVMSEDSSAVTINLSNYTTDVDNLTSEISYSVIAEDTSKVDCSMSGENLTYTPQANFQGVANCTVIASDGITNSANDTFDITVNNVQDAPDFIGTIPNQGWNEDNNVSINLSAYFSDKDGDSLAYSFTPNPVNNISINIDPATGVARLVPDSNWFGTRYVIFDASDLSATNYSNNVTLTVSSVNDAPVLSITPVAVAEETGPFTINLSTYVSDVDNSTSEISYTVGSEDASKVDCNISGEMLTYTLMENYNGTTNCSIIANDGIANSNTDYFVISVAGTQDAPDFTGTIGPLSWNEDSNTTVNLNNYFSDVDGESLTFGASAVQNITISFSNGVATLAPDANWYGTRHVIFNATDGTDYNFSNNVTLTVNEINDEAPVVSGLPDVVFNEDSYNDTINLSDYVTDADTADENITWTKQGDANIIVSIDANKILNISSVANWYGTTAIVLVASDGVQNDSDAMTVTVNSVADAPVISAIADQTGTVGSAFSLTATATDGDNDVSTFTDNSSLFNISSSGIISFTPQVGDAGTYPIMITVNDSTGLTDTEVFNLNISNMNHAPTCTGLIANQVWDEDTSNNNAFDLDTYCSDSDNDTLTYSASTGDNPNIDVTIASNGQVSFTQPADWHGTEYVMFTVSDGQASAETNNVTLLVNNVNDGPDSVTYSPSEDPIIPEDGSVDFSVTISDNDSTPTVTWSVDGNLTASGNTYTFNAQSFGGEGNYTVVANVIDSNWTSSNTWNVHATSYPIANTFDGSTTDFSSVPDLSAASGVVLEKTGVGKMEFTSAIDLSDAPDLDSCIRIDDDVIGIDTSCLPTLENEPARLTFYGTSYTSRPNPFYDSGFDTSRSDIDTNCDFCTIQDYDPAPETSGNVIMDVDHFTVFTVRGNGSTDGLEIKDIKVEVNEDDISGIDEDGGDIDEDVFPGSEIAIEIELENTLDDLDIIDIDIDGELRDIDDGDDIEDSDSISKIDAGEEETITLYFKIPLEVEEDDYDLVINIDGIDEDDVRHTLELNFNVEVEKDGHDLRFTRTFLSRDIVKCKRQATLELRVVNVGEDDEDDVTIEAISSPLNLNYRKTGIELETDPDEDNSFVTTISLDVPESLSSGTYPITVKAYYDGDNEAVSKTINIGVQDCMETDTKSEVEPVQVEIIPAPDDFTVSGMMADETVEDFTASTTYQMLMVIVIILAAGFIIFEIGVIAFAIKKKRMKKE